MAGTEKVLIQTLFATMWSRLGIPLTEDAQVRHMWYTLERKGDLLIYSFQEERLVFSLETQSFVLNRKNERLLSLLARTFDCVVVKGERVNRDRFTTQVGEVLTLEQMREVRIALEADWLYRQLCDDLREAVGDISQQMCHSRLIDTVKMLAWEWRGKH